MRIIGDVHSKYDRYNLIAKGCGKSIQVGDFGFNYNAIVNYCDSRIVLLGNHDNSSIAPPNFIRYGKVKGNNLNDVFCVGGAYSIDRSRRREGVDWFSDEELSWKECTDCIAEFQRYMNTVTFQNPIIVSHDCPQIVANKLGVYDTTFTRKFLTEIFDQVVCSGLKCDWYFGHHHVSWADKIGNVNFRCLDELEYVDI